MSFELLDTVVLSRDLPEHGLRVGDVGAVVEVYAETDFEVDAGVEVMFLPALDVDGAKPANGPHQCAHRPKFSAGVHRQGLQG